MNQQMKEMLEMQKKINQISERMNQNVIMLGGEVWKTIEDYDNYKVSNFGNVKNITSGKLLKKDTNLGGYLNVVLCNNKGQRTKLVHRLLGEAFLLNSS